jgi:hypothetical protein
VGGRRRHRGHHGHHHAALLSQREGPGAQASDGGDGVHMPQ